MNDLILSIDTSSSYLGIGLSSNKSNILVFNLYKKNIHDKLLTKYISDLLNDLDILIQDISAIAVNIGPGSFTGLRVGISFVKALTLDEKPQIIAVSSTENYAYQLRNMNKIIKIFLNSHSNFYYYQSFNEKFESINDCKLVDINDFEFQSKSDYFLVTDKSDLESDISLNKIEYLMELSRFKFNNSLFTSNDLLIPNYVQDFKPKGKTI